MPEPRFALPLNWSWGREAKRDAISLASGPAFVHSAVVTEAGSERELIEQYSKQYPTGYAFKSCGLEFIERAGIAPSSRLLFAFSAKLKLAGFKVPKKVRQLAAKADGVAIAEVTRDVAVPQLLALANQLYPGGEPLRYFFRLQPETEDRCFTATTDGLTAGIVTMSRYAADGWHVDLLLRHPSAPQGTMELLILRIIGALAAEGIAVLNLGEVPMIAPSELPPMATPTRREMRAGRWGEQIAGIIAPLYNVAGLYQFKNKFEPTWEPRYYVGIPKLRLRDMKAMGHASGALTILQQALAAPS